MTSHYRLPVLLIEFDHDKAFALQARSESSRSDHMGCLQHHKTSATSLKQAIVPKPAARALCSPSDSHL